MEKATLNFKHKQMKLLKRIKRDFTLNKWKYLMILPVILFYLIFFYKPMYGAIIAFKDFSPGVGINESPWVGLKHFKDFFTGMYFARTLKNTLVISIASLVFGFPMPIILALLINELRSKRYAKMVQTATYLPHFISLVVICSMVKEFTASTGMINDIVALFGGERTNMLNNPDLFVSIYVISTIWQQIGWNSIVFLAAITGIDQGLYEAAMIDGAGRFRQTLSITIPSILPTIITMFILRIGSLLNVGFERIILLYNPATYETADVISSFVYRKGLQEFNWSFSTAVGLFNSVVNFILLIVANHISKKTQDTYLW